MRRRAPYVAILAAIALAAGAAPADAQTRCAQGSTLVDASFRTALDAIREDKTAPPRAARALAALAVSMDAAMREAARSGRCGRAAEMVRGAAREVIVNLLWATSVADRERARRPRGAAARAGAAAARRTLRRIAGDGLNPDDVTVIPLGPELWQPAPPDFMGPTDVAAAKWRPWNLSDIERVRSPKPPTGAALQEEARQVWRAGKDLTQEQRAIAAFWADGPGTVTPPGHWTQIALDALRGRNGGRLAHDMATVATAQADAFIACWDAKYAYWLARPVTLIHRFDPSWTAALPTPPFPAYVSGHASTSAAAATVIAALVPQRAQELNALAEQAALSRIYGGIHFPVDGTEGLALGRRVARLALARWRR